MHDKVGTVLHHEKFEVAFVGVAARCRKWRLVAHPLLEVQ